MKKMTRVIVFIMAAIMVLSMALQQVKAADNITKTRVADNTTINNWQDANALDNSTKNVGRIWTDKSVSAEDITLTENGGRKIEKGTNSDFLVGLSALSSTAKIIGQTTVPLDIVLVLDVSGSMDDRVTVGAEKKKRIDVLKDAVNNFIDSAAEANDKRADVNKQSRIAVVKFSGNISNRVGNDTYRDGQYTYNYTQVVSKYKAYTSSDKSDLQKKVDALGPAGATLADNAMELTQTLIDNSKTEAAESQSRKNVKRVVIFFTDGKPASFSDFDEKVAERAIQSAKSIKSDADIYTIGVFEGADDGSPELSGTETWTETKKTNAFMHGLSSNYPDAESYNNLGNRAKESAYYKATDASSLNDIFNQIGDEIISSAQSPTDVGRILRTFKIKKNVEVTDNGKIII